MDVDGRIYSDAIKATLAQSLDASRCFCIISGAPRVGCCLLPRMFERARSGVARRTSSVDSNANALSRTPRPVIDSLCHANPAAQAVDGRRASRAARQEAGRIHTLYTYGKGRPSGTGHRPAKRGRCRRLSQTWKRVYGFSGHMVDRRQKRQADTWDDASEVKRS
jgi:hypothetical protein